MHATFEGWHVVAHKLREIARSDAARFNDGQVATINAISERIAANGLILADEVGMGKTRVAVAVIRAVTEAGGRVAIIVPPGLGFQWGDELSAGGIQDTPSLLRSFDAYLTAWRSDVPVAVKPWFDRSVVLISHAFSNWRLRETSKMERWALFPALYCEWRKQTRGRYPRGYYESEHYPGPQIRAAAQSICSNASAQSDQSRQLLEEICAVMPWPEAMSGAGYGRSEPLRPLLEKAVGLGLGLFDLVILDEAHKSRHDDSVLSRQLNSIVQKSRTARVLAMTATPVELDTSQWCQILQRIAVEPSAMEQIENSIKSYADAVKRVRFVWKTSEDARAAYQKAARTFETALKPYLLRRDKREDSAVMAFKKAAGGEVDLYRSEKEIRVRVDDLNVSWKKVVCAAEALSFVATGAATPFSKRLRLTIGTGHGIGNVVDSLHRIETDSPQNAEDQATTEHLNEYGQDTRVSEDRAQWWLNVLKAAAPGGEGGLFQHPAILAAVSAIEAYTDAGEKVLVFGRYTKPLRALTELLNAREMLRCLSTGKLWPQSKVVSGSERDEWAAIRVAHAQMACAFGVDEVDMMLDAQYRKLETRREFLRGSLFQAVDESRFPMTDDEARLFERAKNAPDVTKALIARAVDELIDGSTEPDLGQCAEAFIEFLRALRDRDEGDHNGDGILDEEEIDALWRDIEARIHDEYRAQSGTFASLMHGETKLTTRRTLQLAFNRPSSYRRVLVAQSMVGREGLNLHQACRSIVLLHAEWNPGVVEQQIGRIDRVGSHWSKQLAQALKDGDMPLPQIEVRPVIFEGTYDEHHWTVLQQRWDDLRAQLHGVVVPQRQRKTDDPAESSIIKELDRSGPNFSPTILRYP
ncbi:DEAD/DEAH box helicase [Bradyrhizobium sp. CCGB12]|uniref:DEAD/DEAH box helicase n=1 Tax=Bradyrhizobium sp. CCGB12 TaxID=2949632 RepID=UPI0020B4127B|nr:DEAD/DEAH box helicase [Bradyrhizobium sp. CCGB12]MCP3393909.1 DEAD/DEAH box helicase [Bradyrhizobium sp. CCGB12]